MQNVSVDFVKQLNNDKRAYLLRCEIVLTDGTALSISNGNLWSDTFKIEDAVSNSGSLDIGAAITNKLTFTLGDIYDEYSEYDFTDAAIRNVRVGLVLPDGTEEYVKKGEYTVDETSYNGSLITLECLDNMSKFDVSYKESKLVYPATIGAIVRDACTECGVGLNTFEFTNHTYIVQERPSDEALTFRQVLNWCAQIACCFARCNTEGKLELKWFQTGILEDELDGGVYDNGTPKYQTGDDSDGGVYAPWNEGDTHSGGTFNDLLSSHHFISYTSPEISTDDVVITGILVKEYSPDVNKDEVVPYLTGTEGYVLSIDENRLIPPGRGQEVAAYLGSRMIGLRFRPLSFSCLSDPTVEAGDVGFFTDRKCKTYKFLVTNTVFSSGNYQTVTCDAQTPARNKATRYSAATQAYVELRKQIRKERTEREKALEELGNRLAASSGLYTTVEVQASGGKIFYLHDRPNLADSNIVWKMNAEAWGVSTDGGESWNGGMTVDGDTIVRILTAIGVSASWIDTGRISVKDKDENIIFLVDMDTKEIVISGDSVRIGGKSVTKAIEEVNNAANKALQEAEKMRTLNIQLENDAHVVPTDADGNNGKYAGCDTTVYVLWGQTDISAEVPITVSKSSGVTGTWDAKDRKYTVTNMTTDAGYVDFTVRYMEITATKRFSISKNKQGPQGIPGIDGEDGTDGRTYFINASTAIIKRGQDGRISPTSVTFSSYYRDGDSSERTPYYGRFVISESIDGETWEARYTSETDETSKGYVPTATATALKCVLYAAGGTQTEMDQQTVSIVVDVSNLTQEIIFDTLTNNGEDQGIYLKDGKVYINMTYARGGSLVLGGLNDTNGLLQVKDESDQEIGRFGSNGIVIKKGSLTTVSDTSTTSLNGGRLHLFFNNTEVGFIGANNHELDNNCTGLTFDLKPEAAYMAWAAAKDIDTPFLFKFFYANKDFDDFTANNLYLGTKLNTRNHDIVLGSGGILKSWTTASGFKSDNFSVTKTANNATYFRVTPSSTDIYSNINMHGNSITNQSDARLKDNITDAEDMLNVINSIEIKSFDWLTDGKHVGAGIIAQQLRQIIPELVGEDDNGLLGVNFIGLIPYLIKAIQELHAAVMPSKLARSRRSVALYEYTEEEKMAAVELAKPPIYEDVEPEEIIIGKDM